MEDAADAADTADTADTAAAARDYSMDVTTKDKAKLWDEIEQNYWRMLQANRQREDDSFYKANETERGDLKVDLVSMYGEQSRLINSLTELERLIDQKNGALDQLAKAAEDRAATIKWTRQVEDEKRAVWFQTFRRGGLAYQKGEGAGTAREDNDETEDEMDVDESGQNAPAKPEGPNAAEEDAAEGGGGVSNGREFNGVGAGADNTLTETSPLEDRDAGGDDLSHIVEPDDRRTRGDHGVIAGKPHPPGPQARRVPQLTDTNTGIKVYDSHGSLLGPVMKLDLQNHWIDTLLKLPIRQTVHARQGKKFTADTLASIYEPSDSKGAKWIALMIQAKGEVQATPCQYCTTRPGLFDKCVIIGGADFPRCGGCEWNRRGCIGASLTRQQSSQRQSSAKLMDQPPREPASSRRSKDRASEGRRASEDTTKTGRNADDTLSEDETISLVEERDPVAEPAVETADGLAEITKDTLTLRHDGAVFVAPQCMEGVPVEKIDQDHPYWDQDWPTLESMIGSELQKWEEKGEDLARWQPVSRTTVLHVQRQIKRGKRVLEYIADSDIHPYQVIGKQWIGPGFWRFNTMYRLIATFDELLKFDTDVTPLEWTRQRLQELITEQGAQFNLSKTVHDLYSDPKLVALRSKSGFGSIGRPIGYKVSKGPAARPAKGQKRKSRFSTSSAHRKQAAKPTASPSNRAQPGPDSPRTGTKRRQSAMGQADPPTPTSSKRPGSRHSMASAKLSDATMSPRAHKRLRVGTGEGNALADDLEYTGYTSTDSFSGDQVQAVDWRVAQVKTSKLATNNVTQYWHWVQEDDWAGEEDEADEEDETAGQRFIEHQVLRDLNPTSWGVYKDEMDFHLRLDELTEIRYGRESLRVVIATRQTAGVEWRGDVLAQFKRERTKRRFLSFMKKKGIKLVKMSSEWIENKYDSVNAEVLPSYPSDEE